MRKTKAMHHILLTRTTREPSMTEIRLGTINFSAPVRATLRKWTGSWKAFANLDMTGHEGQRIPPILNR
jgi:hypothetical protein